MEKQPQHIHPETLRRHRLMALQSVEALGKYDDVTMLTNIKVICESHLSRIIQRETPPPTHPLFEQDAD